jgi:hypothetical protein
MLPVSVGELLRVSVGVWLSISLGELGRVGSGEGVGVRETQTGGAKTAASVTRQSNVPIATLVSIVGQSNVSNRHSVKDRLERNSLARESTVFLTTRLSTITTFPDQSTQNNETSH